MIARFHDPAARARIVKELWHGGLGAETPDGILVAAVVNPALEKHVGLRLDEIETRLARQRYLLGGQITEADWRLFPTLVRFDVAYFSLFKCNRQRIADYPNLSNYMRELYQVPGVAGTVKSRYYVVNYWSIRRVNPTGIIPKGTPVDYGQPHDRARLAA